LAVLPIQTVALQAEAAVKKAYMINMFPKIAALIKSFDFSQISSERKVILQPLVDFVQSKTSGKSQIRINFICTHNSRRSHLSQVWAQTAAAYYDLQNIYCYSGGTEATAVFSSVVETLQQTGFTIQALSAGTNPVYAIKFADHEHPVIGFSKTYSDAFNPVGNFAAVMTCSQADSGCPLIAGAETRIPITYDDPKAFDGTVQQEEKYRERSLQIAMEMSYVFSQIKINDSK
jgi:arsenate reductase